MCAGLLVSSAMSWRRRICKEFEDGTFMAQRGTWQAFEEKWRESRNGSLEKDEVEDVVRDNDVMLIQDEGGCGGHFGVSVKDKE